MDDAELSALVRQFQALQKDSVADQITERNVVEIVNTLIKKKLVELLYTTDAKEYMTWDELRREIVEEVHANGGRVNVVDVPGLLSVHTYHVERVLPDILASDPTLRLEGGELMTEQYLEATVQTAAEAIKEQGSLSVAQFATKHQFTSAFALGLLTNAIRDGQLAAVIQDSALYTKQFVRSQRVILRSGLLAAEQPVDVAAVYKRHGLFAPLMETLVKQLSEELPGHFQGHVYTPAVFEAFRSKQVHNIYASNNVIGYAALQSLGISNARQYLVSRYNPNPAGGSGAGPQATSASAGGGGSRRAGGRKRGGAKGGGGGATCGVAGATPVVRADETHPLCGYPLSSCFLADRHLMNLVGLHPLVEGEVLALDVSQLFPLGVDLSKDWAALAPRLTELFPALADCELVEDAVLLRSDAEGKARPQLLEALRADVAGGKKSSKRTGGGGAKAAPDKAAVLKTIAKCLHLSADQYAAVVHEVAERWSSMIAEVQQEVEAAAKDSAAVALKHSRASLQASLTNAWMELVVVGKGLQWAKGHLDETTSHLLCRHALTTRGLAICRDVVLNESLHQPELHAKVVDALDQATTLGNFKKCLAPFPEKARESLSAITTALNEGELERLMEVLQEMSGTGTIAVSSFYAPNKKAEREVGAKMKEQLESGLRSATFTDDPVANGGVFTMVVSLVVSNLFRAYLEIPGKAVGAVVSRAVREADAPASLAACLEVVTSSLHSGSVSAAQVETLKALRKDLIQ